jgi:hypothetical protein
MESDLLDKRAESIHENRESGNSIAKNTPYAYLGLDNRDMLV